MMAYIWRPCPFCDRQHAPAVDCMTARFTCAECGAPVTRFNDFWIPRPERMLFCDSCENNVRIQLRHLIGL